MIGMAWWLNGLALWLCICVAFVGMLTIGMWNYDRRHRND